MSDFDPFDPDDEAGVFNPRGPGHMPAEIMDEEERQELLLNAVQTLTNALGGWEWVTNADGVREYVYRPGDSVLPVLKDLKKLWRKDDTDDERTVARCMHQAGLMKELVSLVCEVTLRGDWGWKVALMAFDLIAALTWPIDVAKELKELEDEGPIVTDYATLLRAQVEYKATILASDTLRCLLAILVPIFAKDRRNDKDERIISLGLHIVRNLLAIRDVVAPDSATGEKEELSTLQSQLLVQLEKLTYLELFNTLASQADRTEFNPFNMLVLDINHLIFRCIKPEQLVKDPERAPIENLTKLLEGEKRTNAVRTQHKGTRHSRFGTTLAARANGQKIVLHAQNAINEDIGKALDNNKRKRATKLKRMDELTVDVYFSADAVRVTQKFTKDFIENCFNDFIASVLKDIRMERSKVRPADTTRALFVAAYAVEYLIVLRRKALSEAEAEGVKAVKDGKPVAELEDPSEIVDRELPLGCVIQMAQMDSVRWVVSRMKISMENKPIAWTELQASIECFTYILLLIDSMSRSRDKVEAEAAQGLQNQLYYNGDILDACLEVVSQYKDQSVAYLETVITFAYVLLRMLERYSKDKKFMFIRKQTAKRKKNKAQRDRDDGAAPVPEEYENDSEGEDMPDDDGPTYEEHAFTFTRFEKKFASEGVCNTLLAYLQRYKELDAEQLRRVVGLIHRQVVKAQAEGLYFQVSSLALFRNIMDHKMSLPKGDSSRDLVQLVTFIVRKFFKRLQEDPFLLVEALMPKTRGRWKELSSWEPDAEGMNGQRARIREQLGPAKLDFIKKRNLTTKQKIGALVKHFIENDHEDYVTWLITIMELILAERREVILTTDGEDAMDEDEPSDDARKKIQTYYLRPSDEKHIEATKNDSHFRLLLETVGFWNTESEPSEADGAWVYPPSELPTTIEPLLEDLKEQLAFPPTDLGDMKSLVRRVYKRRAASDSDSEDDDDGEDGAAARPKRKRRRRDDDDGPRPPRARGAKEVQTYKSAAFIWDSDDDEEADAAFFAREAELRAAMGKAGQDAEEEVRAIMEGKTMRKPVRPSRSPALDSEPGSASDDNAEDEARETDESDEEGDDQRKVSPGSQQHDHNDPPLSQRKRQARRPSDEDEDKENQAPQPTPAKEGVDEFGRASTSPLKERVAAETEMDVDAEEGSATAPVAKRRRVVESDDED